MGNRRKAKPIEEHARSARRPRGRPKKSAAEIEASRRTLLAATRAVFARRGFHGLSVELVIAEAGVSRPTFYKYFGSLHEALDLVLAEVNQELVSGVLEAVDAAASPAQKIEAALLAYRDWGASLGPLLRALFSELHDRHSPTSAHRLRTHNRLATKLISISKRLGLRCPPRLLIDTTLHSVEYLGYRYHLESRRSATSWDATRDAMLRIAHGLLSDRDLVATRVVPALQLARV